MLVILICGAVIGIGIYNVNANKLVGNKLPMPFGYGTAVVLSGSMEPELSKGDLIIVKKDTGNIKPGDVIVFQDTTSLVVHRVIFVDNETITTKGDANNIADKPISLSDIKGKVIADVPAVGHFVNILKKPFGIALTLIIAIILLEIPRKRELKENEHKRQEMMKEIEELKKQLK